MSLNDELPSQVEIIESSLSASSGRIATDGQHIIWEGSIRRASPVVISYRARVVGFGVIRNAVQINDGAGMITERAATTIVPTQLYLPLLLRGNGS